MSPSAAPRDDSGGPGLRSLSASPHYASLMEQLAKAREDNTAPRQPSPPAECAPSAAPAASTTTAGAVADSVDGSAADEERKVSSRVSRTNSLSARLGEKMLAGWTLLGIHCAEDHCPLMKNPRTGDMLCVDCGTVYPAAGGEGSSASSGSSTAAGGTSASATSVSAPSAASSSLVAVSQQPVVATVNGTSTRTRPAAAAVSTSASGDNVEPRAAQPTHRAAHGDDTDDDDDEEDDSDERLDRLAAARLGRVNGSPHADTNGSPPPVTSTSTVNDVSAALSEKLLQGWTMLAVECPNPTCACPLVRKKQGPMLCVQCGSTVVSQEEKERMDEEDRKRGTTVGGGGSGGGAEPKATEVKAPEEKTSTTQQQTESKEPTSQQPTAKREGEERSTSRSGKRTAFADEPAAAKSESGEKRLKNEDDLSDRLSALSSSSLVNSLSSSPLIRPSFRPPAAISSTRPHRTAPPLTDASPSSHTPPSTPAPFPFASPLPASQHLSASISSAFSSHPLFPPPGHITRHNSMAGSSDSGGLPYHANVGMGSLLFGGGPVSQPHSRVSSAAGQPDRGKFSFRSSSAAPSVSQVHSAPVSAGGSSSGLLSAPPSAVGHGPEGGGMGLASPVTVSPANSDNGVTVAVGAARLSHHTQSTVLSSSVDALYGKLEVLRGQLVVCSQVDGMQQIAIAMKEIGQALKVLQNL